MNQLLKGGIVPALQWPTLQEAFDFVEMEEIERQLEL